MDENRCKAKKDAKGATVTYSSTCEKGIWTRAVFDLDFKNWPNDDPPSPGNNWYLNQNKCWPSIIVLNDPGFALNTDDEWYDLGQNRVHHGRVAQYKHNPSGAWMKKLDAQRRQPPLRHDDDSSPTQARNFGSGGGWRRRLRDRQVLQVLDDGVSISDANFTRRLTLEESRRDVEIKDCSDDTCSKEQAELRDETDAVVLHPSRPEAAAISRAVKAKATALTRVATLGPRIHAHMTVSPSLPKHTGSARLG